MYGKKAVWAFVISLFPILVLFLRYNIPYNIFDPNLVYYLVLLFTSFVSPVVGIVLAIIALKEFKLNTKLQGKGFAIAALIISFIWLLYTLILFVFYSLRNIADI